jgi:exonuclease III
LIQCYAPTNDAEESDKDNFYNTLNTILNQQKEKDLKILMGDFNVKVGYNNTGYEQTMGRHGIGQMNENEERFAELCAKNKFVIGGSIFAHKRIHKAAWVSPDHITSQKIRLTISASIRSLEDHFRTFVLSRCCIRPSFTSWKNTNEVKEDIHHEKSKG